MTWISASRPGRSALKCSVATVLLVAASSGEPTLRAQTAPPTPAAAAAAPAVRVVPGSLAAPLPAAAPPVAPPSLPAPDSPSVTLQLIKLLIKNGVLTETQADSLIKQAQQEAQRAAAAPAPARTARVASASSGAARVRPERQGTVAAAATGGPGAAAAATAPVPPGTVRVTYVPQIVRDQIASEVREQVMQEAQQQGWAAPNVLPDWVQRITFSGDLRLRTERDLLSKSNDPELPDFNAINAGSGFDVGPLASALPPLLNTTENRDYYQLRARLNAYAKLDDWVGADIRIATGTSNTPVSTNQTLGNPGDFTKYAIWLDQAYLKLTPLDGLRIYAGRAPDPFWTTGLLYYDELEFDGISAQYEQKFGRSFGGFLNAGAFPVFNTSFNFASTDITKTGSRDAYLFAAQGGGSWQATKDLSAKLGVGYFGYSNVQGSLSSPCLAPTTTQSCDTDNSRPPFVQFGNTMFPIRNIVADPSNPNGSQLQYFGLASKFGILDIHGRVELARYDPIIVALDGDFVDNLAFSRNTILQRGPVNNTGTNGAYVGGNLGYYVGLTVGDREIARLWDWNVSLAYEDLQSDAVLDALTDPNFHLGGTNAKGYILRGNLGLARNLFLTGKWISTNQVSGPTYANDVLQVDLNAKF